MIDLRFALRFTQEEFALALMLPGRAIWNLERGSEPWAHEALRQAATRIRAQLEVRRAQEDAILARAESVINDALAVEAPSTADAGTQL